MVIGLLNRFNMNNEVSGNQNYHGLQNPNSVYSNNQNPPRSYLNNQNPTASPTRTAKANTASKSKMPTDKEILKILFGDRMNNVRVLKYKDVPSILVRGFDYDAWTNAPDEIFIREKPELDEFKRIFTLYHEGLHILQFGNSNKLPTFQEMLRYEVLAYGKSTGWLNTEQAKALKKGRKGFNEIVTIARQTAAYIFRVAEEATESHIVNIEQGSTLAEIDQKYLEVMIDNGFLPNKYVDKEETKRYTAFDLYNKTTKTYFPVSEKK